MQKKTIFLIVCLCLILSMTGYASASRNCGWSAANCGWSCRSSWQCQRGGSCAGYDCNSTCPAATVRPGACTTPVPCPNATATPAATATPVVTAAPTPTATPVVTAAPTPTATPVVTAAPTATATPVVTAAPTATATPLVTAAPTATADNGAASTSMADQVFAQVNEYRAQNGLGALTRSAELDRAAAIRAREIAEVFSHTRPDGSSWSTVSSLAYGENIAKGYSNADKVMAAWISSEGHRANILRSSFGSIGIAAVNVNGTMCWVQLFGK